MKTSPSTLISKVKDWPLKAKLALFEAVLVAVGVGLLAWFVVDGLHRDFERLVEAEQTTAVNFVARTIDFEMNLRIGSLQLMAERVSVLLETDPKKLADYLLDRTVALKIFTRDIYVIAKDGTRVAEAPRRGQLGSRYGDRAYFREVMETGMPVIKPMVGRFAGQPVLVVAVPLKDRDGRVIGALCGSELIVPGNPFHFAGEVHNGENGGFHVVSPKDGVLVTSTDAARVLSPMPGRGVNPLFDRRLEGFLGASVATSSTGGRVLSTAARTNSTDWLVIAYLPALEAFAPVRGAALRIYVCAGLIVVVSTLLIWLFLRHELTPLEETAKRLDQSDEKAFEPVPVSGNGEVRMLLKSFHRMQALAFEQNAIIRYERDQLEVSIAKRRQAEEALSELNLLLERKVAERTAELTSANRELDSFAYAVSHDLRAPLRAMNGLSQALIEDFSDRLDGKARLYLDQIGVVSRNMGELLEGILALSRSTRGELRRDHVDITALASGLLEEMAAHDSARHVAWSVEPGLRADGDVRMIEAVLRNLLGNAWKYTSRTEAAEIRVHAGKAAGLEGICVTDNGAGFDMAHAAQLFQPFRRLHRQDEFPGIGIGLATVQRIIHRHGGEIRAEGVPGKGATFCFTLPAATLEMAS